MPVPPAAAALRGTRTTGGAGAAARWRRDVDPSGGAPYRLPASFRTTPPLRKTISLAPGLSIGGDHFVVMAGPCAVENRELLMAAAEAVAAAGATMLRGGAFKPRTSPRSFQGLGLPGLELLAEASRLTGLPVVTEVMDPRDVEVVAAHAAMLQVGSRNMQNFPLLREVGRQTKPVLLKRGAAATLDELLHAADYIRLEGNERVVLCERGVRSFDPSTRYLLDLAAVPVLRQRTDLPIVIDPSHGTGEASLVAPMAKAALAVGADGLLIEVHAAPERALCDGKQALRPQDFAELMADLRRLMPLCARRLPRSAVAVGQHGLAAGTPPASPSPGSLDDEVIAP
ncbi:MAG: 3-deoxy-7-phosphoheptulonate synthase [Planctomycetes bacterium]|nr:3-deoxy-7-phosphoheptulonate synthase [Planctomycetota bacterium]